jgi:uncharacterized membrane protein YbhN (UPF0104 family)
VSLSQNHSEGARSEAEDVDALAELSVDGGAKRSGVRRWLVLALKAAVSIGVVWYLLRTISPEELIARLVSLDPTWALLAALLLLLQIVLIGWRWFLICRRMGIDVPFFPVLRFTLEGFFFNQALPSSIGGDAVRMMRLHGRTRQTRAAIESVILDRIVGLVSLALLIGLAWPILHGLIPEQKIRAGFALIVILGFVGAGVFLLLPLFSGALERLPIVADLIRLSRSAHGLVLKITVLELLAISLASQAVTGLVFWCLAEGLGLDLSFVHAVVLVPAALLVTLIPISVAGWGLREGTIVGLLSFAHVPAEGALALSILFGLLCLCVSVSGGLLWLMSSPASNQDARGAGRLRRIG